jgi:pimeloyl-ACP methyl ester carboxylesterase
MVGRRLVSLGVGALLAWGAAGCAYWPRTPLPTLWYREGAALRDRRLFVFLPGLGTRPEAFAQGGFVEAVRRRGDADMVSVALVAGHYFNGSAVDRLRRDVILPAREAGYRSIWLVGPSLGGLGSLLYLQRYPGEIAGVVALAPFLGEGPLIEELRAAGGVRGLPESAPAPPRNGDLPLRELWVWLRENAGPGAGGVPPIFLGYGRADRFAEADGYLAEILPAERVRTAAGGHEWRVWRELWEEFLDEIPVRTSAAAANRAP